MELLLDPATRRLPHIFFKGAAHAGECHEALEGHAEGGPKTCRSLYDTVSPSKTYIKDLTKQKAKAKEIKSTWMSGFFGFFSQGFWLQDFLFLLFAFQVRV